MTTTNSSVTTSPISRIGIVGGGQLARMMAESASELGLEVRVLARPDDESVDHLSGLVFGTPDDVASMRALAAQVDVVTFDHEPADLAAVMALEDDGVAVRPSSSALRWADKAIARAAMAAGGHPVPPFLVTTDPGEIAAFADEHEWPVVVKLSRGGFDGRGVHMVDDAETAAGLCAGTSVPLVVEPTLDIDAELAVLVITDVEGNVVVYPAVETLQERGMCRSVLAGALDAALAAEAERVAVALAADIGAVGVLAVELFVVDGRVLINEVAPRPHNSGHLTIDASVTSQFENHLRAVAGLPLGSPAPLASFAAMVNVVGVDTVHDPRARLADGLAVDDVKVHLYGKSPRPERKVGHVTALSQGSVEAAAARAQRAVDAMEAISQRGSSGPDDVAPSPDGSHGSDRSDEAVRR